MASRKSPYETRTVRTERAAAKLIQKGWEVASSTSSGTWVTGRRTAIVLRRVNPKYRSVTGSTEQMGAGR